MQANMGSESKLKPGRFTFSRQYLSIDLAQVSSSLAKLVSQSGVYFSKPLDSARFSLTTTDGTRSDRIPILETGRVFDMVEADTGLMNVYVFFEQRSTPNQTFTMISDEYVSLTINFRKETFELDFAIIGREKADQIGELLTEGIMLVSVELPEQHRHIGPFLLNLLREYPATEQNVFLIMRFKNEPPFPGIVEAVRHTCRERGLNVLRADDKEYTDDLWDNVLTYMYGCDQAIAIFDQINYREFNPNVALEVGFLRAQCKRVLLLKDKAIAVMPADIVGKIYRPFDTYSASTTIPPQIQKWLQDYGIGMQE